MTLPWNDAKFAARRAARTLGLKAEIWGEPCARKRDNVRKGDPLPCDREGYLAYRVSVGQVDPALKAAAVRAMREAGTDAVWSGEPDQAILVYVLA